MAAPGVLSIAGAGHPALGLRSQEDFSTPLGEYF